MLFREEKYVEALVEELSRQKEELLLSQLNEIVERGLLVVESDGPVLVHDSLSSKVYLKEKISLKLKDQEYIMELEEKVKHLQERLDQIKIALKDESL